MENTAEQKESKKSSPCGNPLRGCSRPSPPGLIGIRAPRTGQLGFNLYYAAAQPASGAILQILTLSTNLKPAVILLLGYQLDVPHLERFAKYLLYLLL